MANTRVFFSDLKAGRCSSVVEARLLRFWEAKNVKRGGEVMWMDLLMVDVNSDFIPLFSSKAPTRSTVTNGKSTRKRFFKRLFPPPSPAKCIIARQHGFVKQNEAAWVWIRALIFKEFL
ncbi:hypothetical protein HA466_0017840 [Hirschfeldia incana]|nr:hypothetical protein HA466_0017840 [Hirschfeldia incana]